MKNKKTDRKQAKEIPDFYIENGLLVFTEAYHLKRGYCCKNGAAIVPINLKKHEMDMSVLTHLTKMNISARRTTAGKHFELQHLNTFTHMNNNKVTISWSGGKDSAFALYRILLSNEYEVVSLHTVIGEETKRVGLHGIRESLIEQQAASLGIPLIKLYLKAADVHRQYEKLMKQFYKNCKQEGISGVVFGDIFLEDLKKFREELLNESGLAPLFPLWKMDSRMLINDFLNAGFKTLICSGNASIFHEAAMGKTIDHTFIDNLGDDVDPCGENGEFHTFVYDGPMFRKPVEPTPGDVTKKAYVYHRKKEDGSLEKLESEFWFQELLPRMA